MDDGAGESPRQARREALAWLSLLIFVLAVLGGGGMIAFGELPGRLDIDLSRPLTGWETLWVFLAAIAVLIVLVYVAVILWLLFGRLVFARSEISRVVFYGPTTRPEPWLVDVLFPERLS